MQVHDPAALFPVPAEWEAVCAGGSEWKFCWILTPCLFETVDFSNEYCTFPTDAIWKWFEIKWFAAILLF